MSRLALSSTVLESNREFTPPAFSPEMWPFPLARLPQPAYLVGGVVRDALLGRCAEYLDLDFVLPAGAVDVAKTIAKSCNAGFVLLDAERQIARVVFAGATADFAQQEGATLDADLRRRDFTVNAIAYDPHTETLIDPLGGWADLKQRQICMVSYQNLAEDPLRLLRAYRQAAQLGFAIEPETRQSIHQLAARLERVAAERVQVEIGYLLGANQGTNWLKAAWQDGLLSVWFPDASAKGLQRMAAIDRAVSQLKLTWPEFAVEVLRNLRDRVPTSTRNWLTAAKLACLLSADPGRAETQLLQLKYSRAEMRAVLAVCRWFSQNQPATELAGMTLRQQYEFFRSVGDAFPSIAIAAIASWLQASEATCSETKSGTALDKQAADPITKLTPLIQRFLDPQDPVAHPVPVLSGKDLIHRLQLSPGPQIGWLLEELQLARAEGKIATREEALAFAKELANWNF